MRIVIVILSCSLLFGSALAQVGGDCTFGIGLPTGPPLAGALAGNESFALTFTTDQSCSCAEGFAVESINLLLIFDQEDLPVTFDVVARFHETVYDEVAGRSVPGAVVCSSATQTYTVESAEFAQLVAIPMASADCACAYFGYDYAISVEFLTAFDPPLDFHVDGGFQIFPFESFRGDGSGWTSFDDLGWAGDVLLATDVVCCDQTVPEVQRSWGSIKSLFR